MKIYKYTPHINQFLVSSRLKLTPVQQLNDPFENNRSINSVNDFKRKSKTSIGSDQSEYIAGLIKSNEEFMGIISFSLSKESLPMIAYYANNFKGGVLEFTIEKDAENFIKNKKIRYSFDKVDYIKKRPQDFDFKNHKELVFQKHKDWVHEKEVRLVGDFRQADYISVPKQHIIVKKLANKKEYDNYIIGKLIKNGEIDFENLADWSMVINDIENCHPLVDIRKSSLTAVYLGRDFPIDNIKKINTSKFINLKDNVYLSQIDQNKYKYIYTKLSQYK